MNIASRVWLGRRAAQVLLHPGAFALQVLKAFRANQGLAAGPSVCGCALQRARAKACQHTVQAAQPAYAV